MATLVVIPGLVISLISGLFDRYSLSSGKPNRPMSRYMAIVEPYKQNVLQEIKVMQKMQVGIEGITDLPQVHVVIK